MFCHHGRDVQLVIHGDDFTYLGYDEDLDWLTQEIQKIFEVKIRGRIGPEPKDEKTMRILNRCIEWRPTGIAYEADPLHAEIICQEMGIPEKCAMISTPGVKSKIDDPEDDELVSGPDATAYRRLAARANFLAQDRPDIQYSVKELASGMAKPTQRHMKMFIRLAKYLRCHPRYIIF